MISGQSLYPQHVRDGSVFPNTIETVAFNARLALIADELLEVSGPDLLEVGDAEHEADGIKNVRTPRPM